MADIPEVWYRWEDRLYAAPLSGEYDDHYETVQKIQLRELSVIRHTLKGVWLLTPHGNKFVLKDARKQYACSTKEAARLSFIARKKRQIGIYKTRLQRAEQALAVVSGEDIFSCIN